MKIAIVGGGVSGLTTMHLVHRRVDATLFEASPAVGGHVHTITFDGQALDAGFIVYNDVTYPRFHRLIERLGVATQPTAMTFSVRDDERDIEYSTRALFAQPKNLLRPEIYAIVRDALRFSATVRGGAHMTLGEYLESAGYSRAFIDLLVLPMSAAIWSADPADIGRFPLMPWLRFVERHGMLKLFGRPRWRVIRGGAQRYLDALVKPFRDRVRVSTPVERVERAGDGVWVVPHSAPAERFDEVVLATHSDEALAMLANPSDEERAALEAIPYRNSEVVVHTDVSVLPRTRRAWSGWNYHRTSSTGPTVTYNLSQLARIDHEQTFLVTLNRGDAIDPARVLRRLSFAHPVYGPETFAAQRVLSSMSARIHYCGAYLGYGFHEDGVQSAYRVAARWGVVE
jgi:predicted NAD/FAD-binding protein